MTWNWSAWSEYNDPCEADGSEKLLRCLCFLELILYGFHMIFTWFGKVFIWFFIVFRWFFLSVWLSLSSVLSLFFLSSLLSLLSLFWKWGLIFRMSRLFWILTFSQNINVFRSFSNVPSFWIFEFFRIIRVFLEYSHFFWNINVFSFFFLNFSNAPSFLNITTFGWIINVSPAYYSLTRLAS